MLSFERNVARLFETHNIDFEFGVDGHYLICEAVSIVFIPNCSLIEFDPNVEIPDKSSKTIRLWEDEYINHQDIIESRILSIIGISSRIYARDTMVKTISQAELAIFLKKNHLNAPISAKHRYGLFHQQNLVAIAAFSRSCPIQYQDATYNSHELIRFCSLLGVTVVGGLSKLIRHFEREKNPEHLMTYVDKEWSDGSNYQKLDFGIVDQTPPEIFWLSPEKKVRESEKLLSKHKPVDQLSSEGWIRIENMGNLKLVKFLK